MLRTTLLIAALMLGLGTSVSFPVAASAQERISSPAIQALHAELAEYDLDGDRTINAIRQLSDLLSHLDDPAHQREATFMRAVAASDMLLLANHQNRGDVVSRVARAYGADLPILHARVATDLAPLRRGVYQRTADDAWWALEVLAGNQEMDFGASGLRRDSFFLAKVRRAVEADSMLAIEAIGEDPCPGQELGCGVFEGYVEPIRKRLAVLMEAQAAVKRIRQAADGGDPLSTALSSVVQRDSEVIASVRLVPQPQVPTSLGVSTIGEGERIIPDFVIGVHANQVRFAWAPRYFVNGSGEIVRENGGVSPQIPESGSVSFEPNMRGFIRPIDEVMEALRPLVSQLEGKHVVIGAAPDVPAFVFARVALSARTIGIAPSHIVGADSEGRAVGVPVRIFKNNEVDQASARFRVRVILGGYNWARGRTGHSIPRVHDGTRWHFDTPALREVAGDRSYDAAMLRFMSVAPMRRVLDAAFAIAPRDGTLELVLP